MEVQASVIFDRHVCKELSRRNLASEFEKKRKRKEGRDPGSPGMREGNHNGHDSA